jgi:hypothetical protein
MSLPPLRLVAYGLLALAFTISLRPADTDLTVHEWGTFGSVAGRNGEAIDWLPLSGATDLSGFVAHFRNSAFNPEAGSITRTIDDSNCAETRQVHGEHESLYNSPVSGLHGEK